MARVVVQRVLSASVHVDGAPVGRIGRGLAILLGIGRDDEVTDVDRLAHKVAVMRIFEDAAGKMNLTTADVGGEMLIVPQFTLYADLTRGRRPGFASAAEPTKGRELCERFARRLMEDGYRVSQGTFGAHMIVSLQNDGPVTIVLDSSVL